MKTNANKVHQNENIQLVQCFAVFAPIATGLLWGIHTLLQSYMRIFYISLVLLGWFCWTFAEYIVHRFFLHPRHAHEKHGKGLHHYHHTHPTEIKITTGQRITFVIILGALITANYFLPVYFAIFTGLYLGFVTYCYTHVLLHKKWASAIIPRLQQYHVYHHCKFPDKCFGISCYWWDVIFQTTPPKEARISSRILRFYFEGNDKHPET